MLARLSLLAAVMGAFVLFSAVAAQTASRAAPPKVIDPPAQDAQQPAHISEGQTAFALELYHTLRAHQTGNLFFSPMSITTALSMTAAGARGETADEMANVLRLKDPVVQLEDGSFHPNEKLHAAIGALLQQLAQHSDNDDQPRLEIANALWGQRGYPFLDSFIAFLDDKYDASLTELDFMDGHGAAGRINEWVEAQTEQRIKDLVSAELVQGSVLVLTNAIYFKGDWKDQFNPDRTTDEPFFVDPGTKVTVPMMRQQDRFMYTENDLLQALRLPYTGDSMSMIILLPREEKSLDDVEENLTQEQFAAWMGTMRSERVVVNLPRFTMTEEFELKDVLGAMGMRSAFGPGADFSGIDGSGQMFISNVVHKAFVEVNEEGTEAAAATGVAMPTSAPMHPPKLFRADRPFLFMIHDAQTDSILFIGRVQNPDA